MCRLWRTRGVSDCLKTSRCHPSIVVQNGTAYVEGIRGAFDPMKPFWANRNSETEKPVRDLLKREMTVFQYTGETSMEIAAFLVPARLSKLHSERS